MVTKNWERGAPMKSKYLSLMTASVFVASAGAYADKLDSYGILISDDNSVRLMNHYDAMKACPKGTHLPTIRQLAKLSQASGAKGVLNRDVLNPNPPRGYYDIAVSNQTGDRLRERDRFYYSHQGYQRPSGDLGNYSFWSSSICCTLDTKTAYYLDGWNGEISETYRAEVDHHSLSAVRCVADK